MADEDLNTEGSEKEKADEAAAEKAFQDSFAANADNREGSLRMVGGDDADDEDDQGDEDGDDNSGDDDQGDDTVEGGNADDKGGKKEAKVEAEPTIKDVIAMVQGMQTTIQTNVTRQVGGMLGRLEKNLKPADVTAAKKAATEAAVDKGKKIPSKERVDNALKSVKGFADMEKDFPDYANVLRESLTALAADMDTDAGPAAKPVDENALVDKAVARIRQEDKQAATNKEVEQQEYAKIETEWPGWQEGINTKEFQAWAAKKSAGTGGEEYKRIFSAGSTRETISVLHEFSKETGIQPKKKDGTQSAGKGHQQQQASTKNDDRRRRNVSRPRGSASAPVTKSGDPEEDAFQRSFKERRG